MSINGQCTCLNQLTMNGDVIRLNQLIMNGDIIPLNKLTINRNIIHSSQYISHANDPVPELTFRIHTLGTLLRTQNT